MISRAAISRIRKLEMKKHRMAEGLFIAEGAKVIGELREVVQPVEEYSGEDAMRASLLQHPQGSLALFPIDFMERIVPLSGLKLMLDGVQDPGNVGTIIRIADWFGIDHIYCSSDTADALSPKVVQASMGAIAHVKVEYVSLEEVLDGLPASVPVYGTALEGENIYSAKLSEEGVIVLGSEGRGIREGVLRRVTRQLLIPHYPAERTAVESLNVAAAAAIICSEFRRV